MPSINRIDPNSETWHYIEGLASNLLQDCREVNDNPTLTEIQTAVCRGKIEVYKEILELTKPAPEFEEFKDDSIY
jgi:hypothetical protein